jgi:Rrf2 family transcriptional regulator, nitric oxide-sensitive transcriptional repressor
MQLTQFTDYSLRALIYIAQRNNELCTISEIADSYSISKSHLMKVIPRLSQLGVLKTLRGKKGGLQLSISPKLINLGDLVQKIEPNFFIAECFDKTNENCVIAPVCKLKHILYEALNSFIEVLKQYTLADVIQNHEELSQILFKR